MEVGACSISFGTCSKTIIGLEIGEFAKNSVTSQPKYKNIFLYLINVYTTVDKKNIIIHIGYVSKWSALQRGFLYFLI
jgi:hypothetical protein